VKILFVAQRFYQGGGGAPESLRLMANQLAAHGLSFDVFDRGLLHPSIERLAQLPARDEPAEPFPDGRVGEYGAIIVAGPWQNPRSVARVLRERRPSQRLVYMPRGGLTKIEFSRLRDIKKWPYLYLIERRLVDLCETLVFSSEFEKKNTILPKRTLDRGVVIPDMFVAPAGARASARADGPVTFAFMAEITPLKGLLPLVEAFADLSRVRDLRNEIRLVVGGGVRRGRERYFRKILAHQAAHAPFADITFAGPVTHARRMAFYDAADVFVAPSQSESYGLTVLEGLAAGCAMVAGPNMGVLERLAPHDRMIVTNSTDRRDLKTALSAQFDAVRNDGAERRQDTMDYAISSIRSINDLAAERWLELLEIS
jgi:glycosyltransferase involved in cell wall biosynthesis